MRKPLRERRRLNSGWRFHRGDIPLDQPSWGWLKSGTHNQGGMRTRLDDSSWRVVDLPHDFVIEGTAAPSTEDIGQDHGIPEMWAVGNLHTTRGSLPGDKAWYRKHFHIGEEYLESRIYIQFDGVYRNCTVYLNDFYVGHHLSGYTSFFFDITDMINYGGENLLAVHVDATEAEGWYYEGGGIYRNVWLTMANPVHIAPWGCYIQSRWQGDGATLQIESTITNRSDRVKPCTIVSRLMSPVGVEVGRVTTEQTFPVWEEQQVKQMLHVEAPAMWSPDNPQLYQVVTTIAHGTDILDEERTTIGLRQVRFDPKEGFFLNGEKMKIKGVCCHQDHAGLGVAVPDNLHQFRLKKLKDMGCNAYRPSHHPPTPELLDACDRLGILVMDEVRLTSSCQEGLQQLESMVRRDRNHPCIILWSLGNEESRVKMTPEGGRIVHTMKQLVRKLDPTRPIIMAIDMRAWKENTLLQYSQVAPVAEQLDVMGFNYFPETWHKHHEKNPHQPVLVTEERSGGRTRGCYVTDAQRCHLSGIEPGGRWFNQGETGWQEVAHYPYLSGTFLWTGFDYRGEPSPFGWPAVSSQFGLLDTCGFPKDNYFYFRAWWQTTPVLHIFPHWNWSGYEGKPLDIWCYSNCEEIEVFLNGTSLGRKRMQPHGHLQWNEIPYQPGIVYAKGFRDGKIITTATIETTGPAETIRMTPHQNVLDLASSDACVIDVAVTDGQDRVVPVAENQISFRVHGPGEIIGVGNGDPVSHERDKASSRKAFNGLCQVIVRGVGRGQLIVQASSPGLKPATTSVTCEKETKNDRIPPLNGSVSPSC